MGESCHQWMCVHVHRYTHSSACLTVHIASSAHSLPAMSLQALADFESMEKAFSDLHTRYFKLKELTQALKKVGRLLCYVYRSSCYGSRKGSSEEIKLHEFLQKVGLLA